jgi:hypothetical protein
VRPAQRPPSASDQPGSGCRKPRTAAQTLNIPCLVRYCRPRQSSHHMALKPGIGQNHSTWCVLPFRLHRSYKLCMAVSAGAVEIGKQEKGPLFRRVRLKELKDSAGKFSEKPHLRPPTRCHGSLFFTCPFPSLSSSASWEQRLTCTRCAHQEPAYYSLLGAERHRSIMIDKIPAAYGVGQVVSFGVGNQPVVRMDADGCGDLQVQNLMSPPPPDAKAPCLPGWQSYLQCAQRCQPRFAMRLAIGWIMPHLSVQIKYVQEGFLGCRDPVRTVTRNYRSFRGAAREVGVRTWLA